MHKKMFSAALILYIGFVVWLVLLSRQPYKDVIILPHSKTLHLIFGNASNWPFDVTAMNRRRVIIEDILNIILFIPIGLFIEGFLKSKDSNKSLLWCAILGFICSLLIEVVQLLTKRGLFDVDDLLMNLIGSILGGGGYLFLKWVLNKKQ